jgi:hypothetical protein
MADIEVFGRGIVELSGLSVNHLKIHPAQNYWVFGLCPLSTILETRKHRVSETGSVSILRWGKTPTLLSPSERADLNHWIRWWTKSKNAVILSIIHHHQKPFRIYLFILLLHILESFSNALKIWYEAFILGVLHDVQAGQWSLNHGGTVGLPCLFNWSVK